MFVEPVLGQYFFKYIIGILYTQKANAALATLLYLIFTFVLPSLLTYFYLSYFPF